MQSRWGDDIDEELKKEEKIEAGFMINSLKMGHLVKRIGEETREWDEKYPKSELMKIWGSVMFVLTILFALSYNILLIATGPFYFFYGYVLIQIYGVWKRFKYSKGAYWGMTLVGLVIAAALGLLLKKLIFER